MPHYLDTVHDIMPLPSLTHLQFLVLGILLNGDKPGREVREHLAAHGESKTGPAFYQFMARLEDAGWVEGRYVPKVIDGQQIKERWYTIRGEGVGAWEDTRDFYRTHTNRTHTNLGLQGA